MRHTSTTEPTQSHFFPTTEQLFAPSLRKDAPNATVTKTRRRATPAQGAALEVLGHAIEYLEDTNFHAHRAGDPALQEALQLLRQSSRAVFAASPEVMSAMTRARRCLQLFVRALSPHTTSAAADAPPAQLLLIKR